MDRLLLPRVSLCVVETRFIELALRSLSRSMRYVAFADVILFTDHEPDL